LLPGHPDLSDEEKITTLEPYTSIYNKTKETFLAFRVNIADSVTGRLIGLLGRRSLKPDSGVWIVPANAIHTVGMMFAFDVVMIDKNFRVVSVKELVKPFRIILPKLRAESVIELPAHTIFRSRTEIGDELVIDRYEARKLPKLEGALGLDQTDTRGQERDSNMVAGA
jgi:uncharacterized membrane protein (UPF0127 family)